MRVVDGTQVAQQHVDALWPHRGDVLGTMAVAGVGGIGLEAAASRPVTARPDLLGVQQLGEVVVLDACGVPDEPADGVGTGFGRLAELVRAEAVQRSAGEGRDPPEEVKQELGGVHTQSVWTLRAPSHLRQVPPAISTSGDWMS